MAERPWFCQASQRGEAGQDGGQRPTKADVRANTSQGRDRPGDDNWHDTEQRDPHGNADEWPEVHDKEGRQPWWSRNHCSLQPFAHGACAVEVHAGDGLQPQVRMGKVLAIARLVAKTLVVENRG